MLSKMGWSEGAGLGTALQGDTEFLRVKKREDARGIGMDVKEKLDHVSDHVNSFNDILRKLSAAHSLSASTAQISSQGGVVYGSKRVAYAKVRNAKLVSGYSHEDLANILGKPAEKIPQVPSGSAVGGDATSEASNSAPEEESINRTHKRRKTLGSEAAERSAAVTEEKGETAQEKKREKGKRQKEEKRRKEKGKEQRIKP